MKNPIRIIAAILFLLPFITLAQGAKKAAPNSPAQKADCFHEWQVLFRERGAAPVTDGTHDVVISLWSSITNASKCYLGKVEVSGNKMKRPIMIQKEDGSYEPFSTLGKALDPAIFKTMSEDQLATITDGMSVYFPLSDVEGGQIFFYTFVNPKPKGLKEAPSAKSLVKN